MTNLIESIVAGEREADPRFPHAPDGWSEESARRAAKAEGLELGDAHLEVVRALQEYFARHAESVAVNLRELHDALDEKFHRDGGMRHLYMLFPGGPVAQGCRVAGLPVPPGAVDRGFGSVA
jgi:tRNA 2-thiouridine synthesizing protein E